MENKFGRIFKFNRKLKGYSLENVVEEVKGKDIGINSVGTLSRIENNKENISEEALTILFSSIGLTFDSQKEEEVRKKTNLIVKEIIQLIIDGEDFSLLYKELESMEEDINLSLVYPKYILVQLCMGNYYNQDKKSFEKVMMDLLYYIAYYSENELQILYDCFGYYHLIKKDFKEAIKYYYQAECVGYEEGILALIKYHQAIVLGKTRELHKALDCVQKAKSVFDNRLSFKRSLYCTIQIASIYTNAGSCTMAEELFELCIKKVEILSLQSQLPLIYNNLSWLYIRTEKYDKSIEMNYKRLDLTPDNGDVYFYLSWAYYHLGSIDEAKENMKLAKKHLKSCDVYTKKMIDFFSKFMNDVDYTSYESNLIKLYEKMKLDHFDYSARIFVLKFIIEFYEKYEILEKQQYYLKEFVQIREGII